MYTNSRNTLAYVVMKMKEKRKFVFGGFSAKANYLAMVLAIGRSERERIAADRYEGVAILAELVNPW